MMQTWFHFGFWLRQFLNNPLKVFLVCLCMSGLTLFVNGGLWRLWSLQRDHQTILEQIRQAQQQAAQLDLQISQAKDPAFIERQARDKLDMVSENDLIFVFPE